MRITVGLLRDTSGREEFMLGVEKDMGSRFLRRVMRKGDLAMVMTFDLDVDLLADFTDDHGRLDRAISRAQINVAGGGVGVGPVPTTRFNGGTDFYDAAYLAAHDKLADEARKKAKIILTAREGPRSKLKIQ